LLKNIYALLYFAGLKLTNYHNMRVEIESITNKSRILGNSTSQWGPHRSHYLPNMGTSNNGMPKAKIIVPEFDGSDEREATRRVKKLSNT
jgi:hypothetical protein